VDIQSVRTSTPTGGRRRIDSVIERVGCSWLREDAATARARTEFPDSAEFHGGHGDEMSKCDSWLCVCGHTDSRGGSWEDIPVPRVPGGGKHLVRCTDCGRVYDEDGVAL
jgi:hypothetical protein